MRQTITTTDIANTPSILTGVGTALADASPAGRVGWQIQNLGTNPLYVQLGTGASTSQFHMVLKGGTGNDDGLGASFPQFSGAVYQGLVSVAGTSPRFCVLEMN